MDPSEVVHKRDSCSSVNATIEDKEDMFVMRVL